MPLTGGGTSLTLLCVCPIWPASGVHLPHYCDSSHADKCSNNSSGHPPPWALTASSSPAFSGTNAAIPPGTVDKDPFCLSFPERRAPRSVLSPEVGGWAGGPNSWLPFKGPLNLFGVGHLCIEGLLTYTLNPHPPPVQKTSPAHQAGLLGVFRRNIALSCHSRSSWAFGVFSLTQGPESVFYLFILNLIYSCLASYFPLSLHQKLCILSVWYKVAQYLVDQFSTSLPPCPTPCSSLPPVSMTHSRVVCCSSCLDRPASSCLPDSWQ